MKVIPFLKVYDKANRRVRGLWKRSGSFYVQCTVSNPKTGLKSVTKLRLEKAANLTEAKVEAVKVKELASQGLGTFGSTAYTFRAFKEHYAAVMHKAPKTLHDEILFLNQWEKFYGEHFQISKINAQNILAHRAELLERVSVRTANLHMRAIKQLLNLAKTEGHINEIPMDGIKQLKEKHVERKLMKREELYLMGTSACLRHDRTGKQFADYLCLLMYSGMRCNEALHLRWEHIDFKNEEIVIPGDISKGELRRITFSKNLRNVLLAMDINKLGSDYLFPSFRTDKPITSFKRILLELRRETRFYYFTLHLTRHFFISECVMSGIDYLSIAKWVGHKDGGILIGKVYGHLNAQHLKDQAAKLKF